MECCYSKCLLCTLGILGLSQRLVSCDVGRCPPFQSMLSGRKFSVLSSAHSFVLFRGAHMLSMLLLGGSLFQAPREQCSRTVKSGAKNVRELGRQKAVLFFSRLRPLAFPRSRAYYFHLSCFIFTTSHFLRAWHRLVRRRHRGRVVRAWELQSGGPEFKSRPDRLVDLFTVVPSSNRRLRL